MSATADSLADLSELRDLTVTWNDPETRTLTIGGNRPEYSKVCSRTADQNILPPMLTSEIDNAVITRGHLLMDDSSSVWTVDNLRTYVHETLCRQENLVAEQFELQTIALTRLGVRCGLQFLLRGPRSVRLGAVWTAEQNHVYFYNARGERFLKQPLQNAVAFETKAA